ncbi:hypothetical protein ACJ73_06120 [Blastomyces percursus]|uniref:Uncharacterized protein n=1 Tax=Blastomyces percursus TaxID=1658174 RepID=A0A1J9R4H9_9EURO|nr:hypothetical protein ACJ73_06120 [Blastomyces percursus]
MSIPPATTASASSLQKGQRREYHHRLQTSMAPDLPDSVFTDTTAVDTLLKLSIGVLLHDYGFTHADPVALDSFRSAVEECMYFTSCTSSPTPANPCPPVAACNPSPSISNTPSEIPISISILCTNT